jgi:hypothetical protein
MRAQREAHIIGIYQAAAIYGEIRYFATGLLEMLAAVQNSMVLDT